MRRYARWIWTLVLVGLVLLHLENYFDLSTRWTAVWYSKWLFLMIAASISFAFYIGKSVSMAIFPIIGYSLLSAVYLCAYGQNHYASIVQPQVFIALGKNALYAAALVMGTALVWKNFCKAWLAPIHLGFGIVFALSVGATICMGNSSRDLVYFYGNASMNGALIAALCPFVLTKLYGYPKYIVACLMALALYFDHANVPLGTLFVVTLAFIWAHEGWKSFLAYFAAFLPGSLYLASRFLGHKFMNPDGRFAIWKMTWQVWKQYYNHWFGAGIGSTLVLIPLHQLELHQVSDGLFLWLHSEPIQTVFELGYIGAAFALMAWIYIARRAFRNPVVFASFMGFSAMACFDYPLRLAVHCLCWVLVAGMALLPDEGLRT